MDDGVDIYIEVKGDDRGREGECFGNEETERERECGVGPSDDAVGSLSLIFPSGGRCGAAVCFWAHLLTWLQRILEHCSFLWSAWFMEAAMCFSCLNKNLFILILFGFCF